jgi:hypothetical protein
MSGFPPFFSCPQPARISRQVRSLNMPIVKRLRVIFYLLAMIELVLITIAWGQILSF